MLPGKGEWYKRKILLESRYIVDWFRLNHPVDPHGGDSYTAFWDWNLPYHGKGRVNQPGLH